MTKNTDNLAIPADGPKPLDIDAMSRPAYEHLRSTQGYDDDTIAIDRMQEEAGELQGALMAHAQSGETIDDLAARIDATEDITGNDPSKRALLTYRAKLNSLNYQIDAQERANETPDPEAQNINDPLVFIRSVRDTEIEGEARKFSREKGMPEWKAAEILLTRVKTDGLDAVLPRTAAAYRKYGIDPATVEIKT